MFLAKLHKITRG